MICSITQNKAEIFQEPKDVSNLETEALFGESFEIKKKKNKDWVYGRLLSDNYTGWIKSCKLGYYLENTHKICKIRSHVYISPSPKAVSIMSISLGSRIRVVNEDTSWAEIELSSTTNQRGYIPKKHLKPSDCINIDWIKTAELFVGTPYLWGGRSSFGIDCSGLIQLSLNLSGINFPRNSSNQYKLLRENTPKKANFQRGNLIYWKGHIGIILNNEEILHANGYHMCVVKENFKDVYARMGEGVFISL